MTKTTAGSVWKQWAAAMLCLAVVLGFLFRQSFESEKVLFSNDAPLGLISSKAGRDANSDPMGGYWNDLNWIGNEMPMAVNVSWLIYNVLFAPFSTEDMTPIWNAKLLVPVSFLVLGISAFLLFRTFGFSHSVCVIGALAAALN